MNNIQYQSVRNWIYRNARPVDLARWQYHFEDGTQKDVLKALSAYQNADGGFAYALEADSWNPNSSPIQTWCAIELLREIDISENNNPIIQGILKYLESGSGFINNKWTSEIKSNNDYPHAFWWDWKLDSNYDFNPTANLAGFIIKFAVKKSNLYKKGCEIATQATASLFERNEVNDGHLLLCFIRLYQCCIESNTLSLFDLDEYYKRLLAFIKIHLQNSQPDWCCDGVLLEYIKAFSGNNQSLFNIKIDTIAKYMLENLQVDGTWHIPWNWNDYKDEWAISKNWWKAYGIIVNMLFLKQNNFLPTCAK